MMLNTPRTGLSHVDQIRQASQLLRAGIVNLLTLPRRFLGRKVLDQFIDASPLTRAVFWTIRQQELARIAVDALEEEFAAGHLELCRIVHEIKPPAYWRIRWDDLRSPSNHILAAEWLSDQVLTLQWEILDREGDLLSPTLEETDAVALFWAWQSNRDRLDSWARNFAEFPSDMLSTICFEATQAAVLFDRVKREPVPSGRDAASANNPKRISCVDASYMASVLAADGEEYVAIATALANDPILSERAAVATIATERKLKPESVGTQWWRLKKRHIRGAGSAS